MSLKMCLIEALSVETREESVLTHVRCSLEEEKIYELILPSDSPATDTEGGKLQLELFQKS